MIEILENLKGNHILCSEQVTALKEDISQNYPHYPVNQRAVLFADAVHHLIDKNIIHFDKSIQLKLKNNLLQEVVKKDVFDINAYDIFKAFTTLDLSDEHYIENLTDWINHNQTLRVSRDEVARLTLNPKSNQEEANNRPAPDSTLDFFTPKSYFYRFLTTLKSPYTVILTLITITIGSFGLFHFSYQEHVQNKNNLTSPVVTVPTINELPTPIPAIVQEDNTLQAHLQYKEIDKIALYNWLSERNSLLAEEPYFNSIIDAAWAYNINPLLMFAITGQEQSFVPKSNPKASTIANNPFNVYGSWQDFNTNIADTSKIAARTIINLSEDCPTDEDPLKWLNKKYAEDPNWHIGVSKIFAQLEEIASFK